MMIFSIIDNLSGGGGRVLIDIVKGLEQYQHHVVFSAPLGHFSFGFEKELKQIGVHYSQAPNQKSLRQLIKKKKPALVLYHWWKGSPYGKPEGSSIPWIMINHTPLPMPLGFDHYVSVSKSNYEIQSHIAREKKSMIYNGVDLERFREKQSFIDHPNPFIMGRISHLKAPKIRSDYVDFVKALDIPILKQVIVGDGPMKEKLIQRARELNIIEKFEFPGEVENSEAVQWLKTFHICCYLTDTHIESFSIAILEMLAAGVPVVTEPKGGNPEQITHNYNGFISYHSSDLKRYCELLYKHPHLRQRLSQGAIERSKQFDLRFQQEAYRQLIRGIIKC